jgi:hypothetical protein
MKNRRKKNTQKIQKKHEIIQYKFLFFFFLTILVCEMKATGNYWLKMGGVLWSLPPSVSLPPSKKNHTVSYVKRVLGGGALYSAVWVKIPSPP